MLQKMSFGDINHSRVAEYVRHICCNYADNCYGNFYMDLMN